MRLFRGPLAHEGQRGGGVTVSARVAAAVAARAEEVIVIESDSEEDAARAQRAGSSQGAGPSGSRTPRRTTISRPHRRPQQQPDSQPAQQQQRRAGQRPTAQQQQQQQQQQDEVVDLTSGSPPELGDVHIVSSTAARPVKRPRLPALSPSKQALVAALLNPPALPPPEAEPPGPKCGICLEPMGGSEGRQMASGPCGHVYCKPCLLAALKNQKRCPTCRKVMQPRQVHNVFLNFQ